MFCLFKRFFFFCNVSEVVFSELFYVEYNMRCIFVEWPNVYISKWKVKNCHLVHLSISCNKSTLKSEHYTQTKSNEGRTLKREENKKKDIHKSNNSAAVKNKNHFKNGAREPNSFHVRKMWNGIRSINLFMFELIRSKVKND